jgi:hypothetical protein
VKIDERQVREAARGERQATEWGNPNEVRPEPANLHRGGTDELTAPPYGKKNPRK